MRLSPIPTPVLSRFIAGFPRLIGQTDNSKEQKAGRPIRRRCRIQNCQAILGIVLFLFTIFASLPAWAVTKGFIIYSEYAISDPRVIEFETISWKDGVEGKITKPNGKEDTFVNAWAKNFVYFDRAYFNLIDGVPGFKPMRAFIKGREVVVESNPQETADPDSADRVALDVIALEALQKKFPLFATNL